MCYCFKWEKTTPTTLH